MQYTIVVMPKSTFSHEIGVDDDWARVLVDHRIIVERDIPGAEHLSIFETRKVLYAADERNANLAARGLAEANPGCDVYVLQPTSIFTSAKPEIVQKEISEKGVLPK